MLKIGDLLNRTIREDSEVKKSYVAIVVICSAILILGLFLGLYYIADVDTYLKDNKEIINLYDFYDQKVGENETAIFFIGSSIVGTNIYPPEINRIIKANYTNITVYNLFESDDIPILRTLEIQKIIDAKPSLIIFGITYRSVYDIIEDASFYERTKLVNSRLDLRDDSLGLYTDDEKMHFTPFSDFEKRMYLFSAIDYKFRGVHQSINYSFDAYGGAEKRKSVNNTEQAKIAWINNPQMFKWHPDITNESTRNKDALIYTVKTLQDVGIPVIILNMPLHPNLSEKITDESRANYYTLLNKTGAIWYDFEKDYDEDYFNDGIHATFDGALKFAPRMADLIIEQVEKDVIHYT